MIKYNHKSSNLSIYFLNFTAKSITKTPDISLPVLSRKLISGALLLLPYNLHIILRLIPHYVKPFFQILHRKPMRNQF